MINFNDIEIVAMDCDGTLTDGFYHVGVPNNGYQGNDQPFLMKSFYTRDFAAIFDAMRAGVKIIILTHATDCVIDEKIKSFSNSGQFIEIIKVRGESKLKALKHYFWTEEMTGIKIGTNVAFIGDSDNDLDVMESCAWAGCPSDSLSIIKENANMVSSCPGGRGAVHEFIMDILDKRENNG